MPNQYGGGTSNERVVAFDSTSVMDYELRGDALSAILSAPFSRGGVIENKGGELAVSATNPASFAVRVDSGVCIMPPNFLYSYPYVRDSAGNYSAFTAAHPTLDRIDLVGVLFTTTGDEPEATISHITGTPASTPVAPAASPQTATEYFHPLAEVTVRAGAASIAANGITLPSQRFASIGSDGAGGGGVVITDSVQFPRRLDPVGSVNARRIDAILFDDVGLTRDATMMWVFTRATSSPFSISVREYNITRDGFVYQGDLSFTTTYSVPFVYVSSDRTYVGGMSHSTSNRATRIYVRDGPGASDTPQSFNQSNVLEVLNSDAYCIQTASDRLVAASELNTCEATELRVTSATDTRLLFSQGDRWNTSNTTRYEARMIERSSNAGRIILCDENQTNNFENLRELNQDGSVASTLRSPHGVHEGRQYDFYAESSTLISQEEQIGQAKLTRLFGTTCLVYMTRDNTLVGRTEIHVKPFDTSAWSAWPI